MIIDAHIHPIGVGRSFADLGDKIKRVEDAISFNSRYPELYRKRFEEEPVDFCGALIGDMDRYNIDKGLIQLTTGAGTNDLVADAVSEHPGRLSGLIAGWATSYGRWDGLEVTSGAGGSAARARRSSWEMPSEKQLAAARERAAEEIERCVKEHKMVGVGEMGPRAFSTEVHPEKIARDMRPWMDVAAKHRLPVQFTTGWTQFPGGLLYADPVWTDEIAGRYPEVPIVLTKMGRGLHYFDTALSVAMRNVNVYFDTVGTIGSHIRTAVDTIGAHRIMFGSDWSPTWRWVSEPADLYTLRKRTLDDANLTDAEREQIESRTAAKLFGLDGAETEG